MQGKTTILYKVKFNAQIHTLPTIGFNVETVSPSRGVTFTVWDVGGQYKIRALWKYYYAGSSGLFYAIDSTDVERITESAQELHNILADENMHGILLIKSFS